MTTLIPKFQQPGTGAVNQPINLKLDKIPSITDFDTEANFNTYADTLSAQTNLAIKIPNTQTEVHGLSLKPIRMIWFG